MQPLLGTKLKLRHYGRRAKRLKKKPSLLRQEWYDMLKKSRSSEQGIPLNKKGKPYRSMARAIYYKTVYK